MKSEERHHLHENDLAGVLERNIRRVEPYANQLLVGVLVIAVLLVGFLVWRRTSSATAAKAWGELALASSADGFLTVADDNPNSSVAAWAELRAAELFLADGLRSVTNDRKTADERLGNAEKTFAKLLQNSQIPSRVRERALYGLAVCRESMSGTDTQPSIAAYEELLRAFPDSQYAGIAEQRIASLRSESVRDFYAWLEKQPRVPENRPKPKDLSAASGPGGLGEDPFLQLNTTPTTRPAHPDRPPSPQSAIRSDETARPFPDQESPPVQSAPDATSPPGETPPGPATSPETSSPPGDPAAESPPQTSPPVETPETDK